MSSSRHAKKNHKITSSPNRSDACSPGHAVIRVAVRSQGIVDISTGRASTSLIFCRFEIHSISLFFMKQNEKVSAELVTLKVENFALVS
jgi:hypothetical protein